MKLVILKGNLTDDPQKNTLPSGDSVVNFDIAVNEVYTDNKGQQQKTTDYFEIKAYGKTADNIAQFFTKGRPILIEGQLKQEKWIDKQSQQNRSKVIVRVRDWSFVDSKPQNGQAQTQSQSSPNTQQNTTPYTTDDSDDLVLDELEV